jgi:hypothetical protein
MSNTRSARYHRRRKARLHARLGAVCARCEATEGLTIAHMRGDGGKHRYERGNAGEITRLLSLPDHVLLDQIALLCWPCHEEHDLAAGYLVRF